MAAWIRRYPKTAVTSLVLIVLLLVMDGDGGSRRLLKYSGRPLLWSGAMWKSW